jgi:hypothetical protein
MKLQLPISFVLCLGLCATACGDSGPEPHIVSIVADDGSVGGVAITQAAVDEIEIIIVPDPSDGAFEPLAPTEMMGGDVEVRVSAVGEFVLKLRRGYIDRNAIPTSTTFRVDVPLVAAETMDGHTFDPTLRVTFIRAGERIAESNPRFLSWPIPVGEDPTSVLVRCKAGFTSQCENM